MFIFRPSDRPKADQCGRKAASLAVAGHAGLPVPPWFAISPAAFDDAARLTERAREEIAAAIDELCPRAEPVAVRSSAVDEDGSDRSFAGQLESYLNVPVAAVSDRATDVCRSAFGDRVKRYRLEHGLSTAVMPPAVIVQRMIDADRSGVAFSADPVSGRRGVAVVSAVRGLGVSLVSGAVDGDTYHVNRANEVVCRSIAGTQPVLEDTEIQRVATLARDAARVFGCPQDIEWAFESGNLYLLQSRPITSLDRTPDEDGVLRLWDNSNIVESYSGVTTPLTFSFAREAYENVYREFCRIMRVPSPVIAEHDDLFRNMLGLMRGRVYYNLLNWYRLIALLPGFAVNRRFMEQMMGVREKLPEAFLPVDGPPALRARVRDAIRAVRAIAGLGWSYLTLDRRTAAFYVRVDTALAPPDPPLAERRADEISIYYGSLRRQLLRRWDAPILNDFFTMIFYGALRDLAARWCGDKDGALQNDLIAGERGMVSAQPAWRVEQLAALAARHETFVQLLLDGTVPEILSAAREIPSFIRQYQSYLRTFGERCADELKLETTTLEDDPLPLLRAIGGLARRGRSGNHAAPEQSSRARAEQQVKRVLTRHPVRRMIFNWVLANARARVRDRENLRFIRTRLFGRVRRTFVELGLRLHESGYLNDPRDVFYLQVEEILAFVDGRAVTTDLESLVALRRMEFDAHAKGVPPDPRFETRGVVYEGNSFRAHRSPEVTSVAAPGSERKGLGCCPGVRRGPVRVVRDPATAVLEVDSILVAERTDPGWIVIFPAASGLIVERGSLLSHSAIVARELGIPAIVSVDGVTSWLRDGDWVEMDGSTGIVRKLAA